MIITRFHDLEKLEIEVEFLTPCFLGGADQNTELRSAPFKSMLRQWWRISNGHFDDKKLSENESKLFGSTQKSANRSLITISLNAVTFGKPEIPKQEQLSILKVNGKSQSIKPLSYVGYGPISMDGKWKNFIAPGSKLRMEITAPKDSINDLKQVLHFAHYFGSLGSRSRNGWGAFTLSSKDYDFLKPIKTKLISVEDIFKESLKNYPWVLGKDGKGPLCWKIQNDTEWSSVMINMAQVYATLRYNNKAMKDINARAILGYPLTNAEVRAEKKDIDRIPKQLRMTVHKKNGKFIGVFIHFPYKLPCSMNCALSEINLWKAVYAHFDASEDTSRYTDFIQEV
ncbi:MAG: hypothetical protein JW795_23955 [Chitinivibrionales bacterium]|nr:hypothetical protein [Chitinivibrionales bacterium]